MVTDCGAQVLKENCEVAPAEKTCRTNTRRPGDFRMRVLQQTLIENAAGSGQNTAPERNPGGSPGQKTRCISEGEAHLSLITSRGHDIVLPRHLLLFVSKR